MSSSCSSKALALCSWNITNPSFSLSYLFCIKQDIFRLAIIGSFGKLSDFIRTANTFSLPWLFLRLWDNNSQPPFWLCVFWTNWNLVLGLLQVTCIQMSRQSCLVLCEMQPLGKAVTLELGITYPNIFLGFRFWLASNS